MLTTSARLERMFPAFSPFPIPAGFFGAELTPWSRTPVGTPAFPALNVWEADEGLTVEAELPGFSMADIEVELTGSELTIRGQRDGEGDGPAGSKVLRRERTTGAFERTLRIGVPIDADRVTATLDAGVLRITLPASSAARARTITVQAPAPTPPSPTTPTAL